MVIRIEGLFSYDFRIHVSALGILYLLLLPEQILSSSCSVTLQVSVQPGILELTFSQ